MQNLVPFDFIKPTKLLYGLGPWDYLALDKDGNLLARGTNKIVVLETPGIYGYFNLREAYPLGDYPNTKAKAVDDTPVFDAAPWGSLGKIETIPGQPLIEPKVLDQKTLDAALKGVSGGKPTQVMIDGEFMADGPRRLNAIADAAMQGMKRDPLDHDGDGRKGGSVKGTRKRKAK